MIANNQHLQLLTNNSTNPLRISTAPHFRLHISTPYQNHTILTSLHNGPLLSSPLFSSSCNSLSPLARSLARSTNGSILHTLPTFLYIIQHLLLATLIVNQFIIHFITCITHKYHKSLLWNRDFLFQRRYWRPVQLDVRSGSDKVWRGRRNIGNHKWFGHFRR